MNVDLQFPDWRPISILCPEDQSFTSGPNLLHKREYAGCTLFRSAKHNNRTVVLAAGGDGQRTAEILDYTGANVWEESKPIYPM